VIAGATVTAIALVSYTAMAGVVGAGGLGDLAIRFGYQRFQTARIAAWVAAGETYRYRFTPASLARADKQGIRVEQVLSFLGRASGGRLPGALVQALRRWAQAGTQVRLRDMVVLQVTSAQVLEALRASPAVRPYLGEALGPLAVAVRRADWPRLEQAIRQIGYLPEVEGLEE